MCLCNMCSFSPARFDIHISWLLFWLTGSSKNRSNLSVAVVFAEKILKLNKIKLGYTGHIVPLIPGMLCQLKLV